MDLLANRVCNPLGSCLQSARIVFAIRFFVFAIRFFVFAIRPPLGNPHGYWLSGRLGALYLSSTFFLPASPVDNSPRGRGSHNSPPLRGDEQRALRARPPNGGSATPRPPVGLRPPALFGAAPPGSASQGETKIKPSARFFGLWLPLPCRRPKTPQRAE